MAGENKQLKKVVEAAHEIIQNDKGSSKASRAKFWLGLQSMHKNPLTRKMQLLSQEDMMTFALIKKAKSGNVLAYTALMDRAYGKPKQETESTITKNVTIAAFTWGEVPKEGHIIQHPEEAEIEAEITDAESDITEEE